MLMKREQEGKAFCSRLSAPLRRYRTRTTGGYVASPSLRPNLPSVNFTYPQNIIRNAVPKKDKKEGRENLKTEKVFIWKKVVANNREVVTTEQETGCSKGRNFDYT